MNISLTIMIYAFLTCLKRIIERDLEELEKYLKKEVINNGLKLNDNDGASKTN